MTAPDTLNINIQPFYQWDSVPYDVEAEAPDAGVAVGDTFSYFFIPDSSAAVDAVVRPSLFQGHMLAPQHDVLAARTDASAPVWVFGLLVALVALTTLYYHRCKLNLKTLALLLFDSRAMDRTLRNNNLNSRVSFIPMGLLMLACLMLPVQQMALAKNGISGYILLLLGMTVLYLLRNGLLRLLAVTFDNGAAVETYITSNYMYHMMLATLALPLVFLLVYLPYGRDVVLYVLAALLVLEFAIRLFRGLKLFLTQSSGPYIYLFYYLCIVEIAPILLLVKWLIE